MRDRHLKFHEARDNLQFPATGDKHLLAASFAKVRALKERMPDLVILPAHDQRASEKLRAG